MKLTIRIYAPGDPFHKRLSFYDKRRNGNIFIQFAFGDWAVMFAWVVNEKSMPFFMYVDSD
jgi:hypothetical protein